MKTRSFEECCNEVARKLGQYVSEDHHKGCFYSRQVLKEAAELYNSETSKERDNALLSVALYVKELNDLKEERDRLKEENERLKYNKEEKDASVKQLLQHIDSLKQLNSAPTEARMKKLDSESILFIMFGAVAIVGIICLTILALNGIIKP